MEIAPYAKEGKQPPIHPDYNPDNPEDRNWDGRSSIANIFFGQPIIPYPTNCEFIDILPGHASKLLEAEQVSKDETISKLIDIFHKFIWSEAVVDNYDLIIIDTGPSKAGLTRAAIHAATHLIIPAIMEFDSIEGVYGMMHLWKQENYSRDKEKPLKLIGILPNKFKGNTSLHRDLLKDLQSKPELGNYVLEEFKLSDKILFAETDAKGVTPNSVFELSDSNKDKIAVSKTFDYIMEKIIHG